MTRDVMTDANQDPQLERLLEYLKQTRGFNFTAYKRSTLARRIATRMRAVDVDAHEAYLDYLEVHPEEFGQLFNSILINVTAFFRDAETFDYLRDHVVPAIVERNNGRQPIRIWSAGCASGEECYSVAMLFAEALGSDAFRERVKIYATDIDEEALAQARQASYGERQVEAVDPALREKYFDRHGARWTFKQEYRRSIIFGRHDLLDDAPISRVDLLVCRNTLMYFNQEAQAKIVGRFHFALREGGFLVLGRAEMLVNFSGAFAPVDLKQRVFVKIGSDAAIDRVFLGYPGGDNRGLGASTAHRLRDIVFEQDPFAQFVVDGKGHLVAANLRARDLFGLTGRDIGRPVQDLEVSYRPAELRSCIEEANQSRHVVQLREVAWPLASGDSRYFNVQVTPIFDVTDSALGTKIVFIDVTRQHELQEELQRSRQELETAYEELQSTNEELETTNEELQSTVEELETTNEELQSTNEELETMNEALQSTNEELDGANRELRQRGTDLARSNIFLSGILRNVPLGVVVLNGELEVELWNDVATELWGLRHDEVQGQPFFTLDIGLPVGQLRSVIDSVQASDGDAAQVRLAAINRRGRRIDVNVMCAAVGTGSDHARGVIVLMQESASPADSAARLH
jgi:two-component system CheB/CheR fusion protein